MAPRELSEKFVTAQELAAVAEVAVTTLRNWTEIGLLPRPTRIALGYPDGSFLRYPAEAVLQVRWIVEQRRDGHTLKEIKAMLRATPKPWLTGAGEPGQDEPTYATTIELMAVADCSAATIYVWTRAGLLPKPTRVYSREYNNHLRYPRSAIAIASFIADQRTVGVSLGKIREMLEAGLGPPMP